MHSEHNNHSVQPKLVGYKLEIFARAFGEGIWEGLDCKEIDELA